MRFVLVFDGQISFRLVMAHPDGNESVGIKNLLAGRGEGYTAGERKSVQQGPPGTI